MPGRDILMRQFFGTLSDQNVTWELVHTHVPSGNIHMCQFVGHENKTCGHVRQVVTSIRVSLWVLCVMPKAHWQGTQRPSLRCISCAVRCSGRRRALRSDPPLCVCVCVRARARMCVFISSWICVSSWVGTSSRVVCSFCKSRCSSRRRALQSGPPHVCVRVCVYKRVYTQLLREMHTFSGT